MISMQTFHERPLLFGLVLILGLGILFAAWRWSVAVPKMAVLPQAVVVGGESYVLEIADTGAKRSLGLGERDSLCPRCGMLFVFDYEGRHGFWMEGMRFPLDIVWLQKDTIVHIERRILPEDRMVYRPPVDADQVLEFNAGAADELQIGERVLFLFPE